MLDFIAKCFDLDMNGWFVLLAFGVCGYTLISQMLDDHATAMLGTPMLVFGAALGNRLFQDYGIQTGADKLSEMVIGMIAGMMIAGILLLATLWLWTAKLAR